MCPLKVCLVKQSVSKRQKKIPHSPILLRIDWKVPPNRRILAPGWAGPLRQFSQELEGCSGHRRQMELERTNSCDKSGNGWCICPPLWGKNHRWKELIKANKKNPCRQSWEFYLCVFLPTEKEHRHHAGRNMDFGIKPGSGNWLHYFCVWERPQAHLLMSQGTSVASHIVGAKQHLGGGVELDRSCSMQRMQSKA